MILDTGNTRAQLNFTNTFCKWQIFMIFLPSKTNIQQFCTKQKKLLFKPKVC